jgi:60 kDa SS-A/Ro ribonucleoprotein
MAKFNVKAVVQQETATNFAGGRAFIESPELEFASLLLTSFVKDQFYRDQTKTIDRVSELLDAGVRPEFAAKAAVYARNQYNMRSISHVVAGELAHRTKSSEWMRPFVKNVVVRVDDMLEILAYYEGKYGRKPVPNALKRGIRDAFDKFDGYQLAKYRGEGKTVKLVDAVNLVHPAPTDRNREALKQLVEGTLRSTETWESKLTQAGQAAGVDGDKAEMKSEAWAELVRTRKIGYMALVRNLRNIIEDAPDVVYEACIMLLQPSLVQKSRMLPFRFVTARDEIEKVEHSAEPGPVSKAISSLWGAFRDGMTEGQTPRRENKAEKAEATRLVLQTLNKAADIALANVPRLEGRTLVVVDESGSMTWGDRPIEIASLFAAVLLKANTKADLMMFSNTARYVSVNRDDTLLTIQRQIASLAVAGGTNFNAIFDRAETVYDRIVILSDMQGWMSGGGNVAGAPTEAFARYRRKTGADPHVYSFDLQGYGTLMFPERNVYALAGFSEKVFDVMPLLEQDREALIHEIEAVQLA